MITQGYKLPTKEGEMNCEYCGHEHKPDPFVCIARLQEERDALRGERDRLNVAVECQKDTLEWYRDQCNSYLVQLEDCTEERDTLRAELAASKAYADKLAAGLPEGMLPRDIELLREANVEMATELAAANQVVGEYRASLVKQSGYIHEIEGELARAREALERKDKALKLSEADLDNQIQTNDAAIGHIEKLDKKIKRLTSERDDEHRRLLNAESALKRVATSLNIFKAVEIAQAALLSEEHK